MSSSLHVSLVRQQGLLNSKQTNEMSPSDSAFKSSLPVPVHVQIFDTHGVPAVVARSAVNGTDKTD